LNTVFQAGTFLLHGEFGQELDLGCVDIFSGYAWGFNTGGDDGFVCVDEDTTGTQDIVPVESVAGDDTVCIELLLTKCMLPF
jgi:hypothetical protein